MKLPTLKISVKPAVIIVLAVAIATASTATGAYFYQRATKAEAIIRDPQKLGKEEAKQIIADLKKLMQVPGDEEPTIATVADAGRLKDQPFFSDSQNGDRVIVYTKARKAILYRPSIHRIIDVAPITLGENQGGPAPTGPVEQTSAPLPFLEGTAVILNGTNATGVTKPVEDLLKDKAPGLVVKNRDNAVGRAYSKTIVIDGTKGAKQELARVVAESLGASLSGLPDKEATPTTDLVIIVGEDKK